MYFCLIYCPFQGLRMFKIICYVDDIIGVMCKDMVWFMHDILNSLFYVAMSPPFIPLCLWVFMGDLAFWRCYVSFLYVIGLMLFWRFYDEKWGWLYHHEKAWVINWTSSFFTVACQVLLMYATLWWHSCWFYGWFEGVVGSMLIYHLICW